MSVRSSASSRLRRRTVRRAVSCSWSELRGARAGKRGGRLTRAPAASWRPCGHGTGWDDPNRACAVGEPPGPAYRTGRSSQRKRIGGVAAAQMIVPEHGPGGHESVQIAVADLGVGIEATLSRSHPDVEGDPLAAINKAMRPRISGTFEEGGVGTSEAGCAVTARLGRGRPRRGASDPRGAGSYSGTPATRRRRSSSPAAQPLGLGAAPGRCRVGPRRRVTRAPRAHAVRPGGERSGPPCLPSAR